MSLHKRTQIFLSKVNNSNKQVKKSIDRPDSDPSVSSYQPDTLNPYLDSLFKDQEASTICSRLVDDKQTYQRLLNINRECSRPRNHLVFSFSNNLITDLVERKDSLNRSLCHLITRDDQADLIDQAEMEDNHQANTDETLDDILNQVNTETKENEQPESQLSPVIPLLGPGDNPLDDLAETLNQEVKKTTPHRHRSSSFSASQDHKDHVYDTITEVNTDFDALLAKAKSSIKGGKPPTNIPSNAISTVLTELSAPSQILDDQALTASNRAIPIDTLVFHPTTSQNKEPPPAEAKGAQSERGNESPIPVRDSKIKQHSKKQPRFHKSKIFSSFSSRNKGKGKCPQSGNSCGEKNLPSTKDKMEDQATKEKTSLLSVSDKSEDLITISQENELFNRTINPHQGPHSLSRILTDLDPHPQQPMTGLSTVPITQPSCSKSCNLDNSLSRNLLDPPDSNQEIQDYFDDNFFDNHRNPLEGISDKGGKQRTRVDFERFLDVDNGPIEQENTPPDEEVMIEFAEHCSRLRLGHETNTYTYEQMSGLMRTFDQISGAIEEFNKDPHLTPAEEAQRNLLANLDTKIRARGIDIYSMIQQLLISNFILQHQSLAHIEELKSIKEMMTKVKLSHDSLLKKLEEKDEELRTSLQKKMNLMAHDIGTKILGDKDRVPTTGGQIRRQLPPVYKPPPLAPKVAPPKAMGKGGEREVLSSRDIQLNDSGRDLPVPKLNEAKPQYLSRLLKMGYHKADIEQMWTNKKLTSQQHPVIPGGTLHQTSGLPSIVSKSVKDKTIVLDDETPTSNEVKHELDQLLDLRKKKPAIALSRAIRIVDKYQIPGVKKDGKDSFNDYVRAIEAFIRSSDQDEEESEEESQED
ncbi:hypothetical protein QKU94_gp3 [Arlivirus sp. virus]|uniref:Phosphoprotein n=1 Tax=Arlivirus sp. virus TaxID=2809160 RepID=A0AAX1PCK5_9MONO|nr:hypothetical protein QKU94_gp3 [Arlivirus sp. virus]QXV86527.1 hypothetical protein [Arlivirus sp. virus]